MAVCFNTVIPKDNRQELATLRVAPAGDFEGNDFETELTEFYRIIFMTKHQATIFLPILQAFTAGHTIQFQQAARPNSDWIDYDGTSGREFGFSDHLIYRIKPQLKWRAWLPKDVPMGVIIREKISGGGWAIPLGVGDDGIDISINTARAGDRPDIALLPFEKLLADYEYSPDQGHTWLPCGVLES